MQFDIYGRSLNRSEEAEKGISRRLVLHDEPQTQMDFYENATYFRDVHCLYDKYGVRIAASRLWRDRGSDNVIWPETGQEWRDVRDVEDTYDEPVVYAGVIFPHYGHFVMENISRLWTEEISRYPTIKLLYSDTHRDALKAGYVAEFFAALGISLDRIVTFSKPTRLRSVLVPHQSCFLRGEAYPNHVRLPRHVAEAMLGGIRPTLSDTPAYLSRTQFKPGLMANDRRLTNENVLEAALRNEGVAIYYPERMTLAEQVRAINNHRWVIGTRGSAFHTLLFSLAGPEQHTCILYEAEGYGVLVAYGMVDQLAGTIGHYLGALSRSPTPATKQETPWDIDIDLALAWLAHRGVIYGGNAKSAYARVVARQLIGRILVHVAGTGDVTNEAGLKGGIAVSGRAIEGIQLTVDKFPLNNVEYKVMNERKIWGDWVQSGTFVGSRGKSSPITGFAMRLVAPIASDYECIYTATFVGEDGTVIATNGKECQSTTGGALESLQIDIIARKNV